MISGHLGSSREISGDLVPPPPRRQPAQQRGRVVGGRLRDDDRGAAPVDERLEGQAQPVRQHDLHEGTEKLQRRLRCAAVPSLPARPGSHTRQPPRRSGSSTYFPRAVSESSLIPPAPAPRGALVPPVVPARHQHEGRVHAPPVPLAHARAVLDAASVRAVGCPELVRADEAHTERVVAALPVEAGVEARPDKAAAAVLPRPRSGGRRTLAHVAEGVAARRVRRRQRGPLVKVAWRLRHAAKGLPPVVEARAVVEEVG